MNNKISKLIQRVRTKRVAVLVSTAVLAIALISGTLIYQNMNNKGKAVVAVNKGLSTNTTDNIKDNTAQPTATVSPTATAVPTVAPTLVPEATAAPTTSSDNPKQEVSGDNKDRESSGSSQSSNSKTQPQTTSDTSSSATQVSAPAQTKAPAPQPAQNQAPQPAKRASGIDQAMTQQVNDKLGLLNAWEAVSGPISNSKVTALKQACINLAFGKGVSLQPWQEWKIKYSYMGGKVNVVNGTDVYYTSFPHMDGNSGFSYAIVYWNSDINNYQTYCVFIRLA